MQSILLFFAVHFKVAALNFPSCLPEYTVSRISEWQFRVPPRTMFSYFSLGLLLTNLEKTKKDVQASLLPEVRRTTNEKAVRPKWVSFLVTTFVLFPYDCRILLESESSLTETVDCSTASFSKRFPPTKPCIHIDAPDILTTATPSFPRGFYFPRLF